MSGNMHLSISGGQCPAVTDRGGWPLATQSVCLQTSAMAMPVSISCVFYSKNNVNSSGIIGANAYYLRDRSLTIGKAE